MGFINCIAKVEEMCVKFPGFSQFRWDLIMCIHYIYCDENITSLNVLDPLEPYVLIYFVLLKENV